MCAGPMVTAFAEAPNISSKRGKGGKEEKGKREAVVVVGAGKKGRIDSNR